MKKRKNGYGVLLALTILLTLAALATLIPSSSASKECALGYKALCTFAPMGTVVLLLAAGAGTALFLLVTCFALKRRRLPADKNNRNARIRI